MRYGARMPRKIYYPPYFVDQDWRKPNRRRYMAALAEHRPHMATVLDLEREEQLPEVLDWAHEAAEHVQTVVIIPKCSVIDQLPHTIGSAGVRLGYSVPTRYGACPLPLWEFGDRPVHLLGGGATKQLELRHYLNVQSIDGNVSTLAANKGWAWDGRRWRLHTEFRGEDFPYRCFERSCRAIVEAWQPLTAAEGAENE